MSKQKTWQINKVPTSEQTYMHEKIKKKHNIHIHVYTDFGKTPQQSDTVLAWLGTE